MMGYGYAFNSIDRRAPSQGKPFGFFYFRKKKRTETMMEKKFN